jgi:hypothetical protein
MNRGLAFIRTALVLLAAAAVFLLLIDYFTPAELQVDLNAPRFRLVRHRMILPDQEFEMEWKPSSKWQESLSDSTPIFGERTPGEIYAWEVQGTRFETLYSEALGDESDAWVRTNLGTYKRDTRELPTAVGQMSRWIQAYSHQETLLTEEEKDAIEAAAESAKSSKEKEFEAKLRAGIQEKMKEMTNSASRPK